MIILKGVEFVVLVICYNLTTKTILNTNFFYRVVNFVTVPLYAEFTKIKPLKIKKKTQRNKTKLCSATFIFKSCSKQITAKGRKKWKIYLRLYGLSVGYEVQNSESKNWFEIVQNLLCVNIKCTTWELTLASLKGHWTSSTSSPTFSKKSWDFYTITSVGMGNDCMPSFMF